MKKKQKKIEDPKFLVHQKMIRSILMNNRKLEPKKIYLFLDFDGVVNVFLEPGTPEFEAALKKKEFDFANRDCVARIDRLCHTFPIEIVLSSSWRYSGLEYCREYLMKYGLSEDVKFAGTTAIDTLQKRQLDIADYLVAHPDFSGFLILDDINMSEFGKADLVMNPLKGFDDTQYEKASEICTGFLKGTML